MKAFITRQAKGEPSFTQPVIGVKVGPFCVHPSAIWGQRKFVCTHAGTGFSAFTCDNKKAALSFAKKLAQLPVSWDFDNPDHVKTFPKEISKVCRQIVIEAAEVRP